MEPCETYECVMKRLQGRAGMNNSENNEVPEEGAGLIFSSTSFRILLPILSVLGLFVLVAISLVAHRIIRNMVKKRWGRRHVTPSDEETGRYTMRDGVVNTISGCHTDLPSYGQVLAAIEREGGPPPYFEVTAGTINEAFAGDGSQLSHLQSTSNDVTEEAETLPESRVSQQREPNEVAPPSYATSSEVNVLHDQGPRDSRDTTEMSHSCNIMRFLPQSPQSSDVNRNTTTIDSPAYRNTSLPLTTAPVAVQNIEELINSISVPSTLPSGSIRGKNKRKGNISKTSSIYTSFSCSFSVPKIPTNAILRNNANETSIVLESTPI